MRAKKSDFREGSQLLRTKSHDSFLLQIIRSDSLFVALVTLMLTTSGLASPDVRRNSHYVVQRSGGTVLTRGFMNYEWKSVRDGQKIPEGNLLQTFEGAFIDLKYHPMGGSKDTSDAELTLKISIPTVVRLLPGILRKVSITQNFFQTLPSIAGLQLSLSKDELSLKNAWSKVTAQVASRMSAKVPLESWGKKDQFGDGIQSSIQAKKIEILTPYSPLTLRLSSFPHEVMVRWKTTASKQRSNFIYLWPVGRPRPAPVAETRQNQYTLALPLPGTYFMQVASRDGSWQSEVQVIEAIHENLEKIATRGNHKKYKNNYYSLHGSYPPNSHEILTSQGLATEFFRWDTDEDASEMVYEWVLVYRDGREARRVVSDQKYTRQEIPPGFYDWFVEAHVKQRTISRSNLIKVQDGSFNKTKAGQALSGGLRARSEVYHLTVERMTGDVQRAQKLSDFLSRGGHGAIYLSEGL
jgi:hypothetical protein